MNFRKIKLALTVDLINGIQNGQLLKSIKNLMNEFKEAGKFIGLSVTNSMTLNKALTQRTFAIQYENVTLDLNVITNTATRSQYVQNFNLR